MSALFFTQDTGDEITHTFNQYLKRVLEPSFRNKRAAALGEISYYDKKHRRDKRKNHIFPAV